MDVPQSFRPRLSRETRRLLTAALAAVAALWVLARVRFPESPVRPNPVAPLLSQLATPPGLDSLVSEISQLQNRLDGSLVALEPGTLETLAARGTNVRPVIALRLRDDLAIALLDQPASASQSERIVAVDPASGEVVVRVPGVSPVPTLTPWRPRRLDRPQFLMVTATAPGRIGLEPVFVTGLDSVTNALYSDPLWAVPTSIDADAGAFVFTTGGEFVGAVGTYRDRRVILPGTALMAAAERLVKDRITPAGDLRLHVQTLTPDVALATGAVSGVVVTWSDRTGPANGVLAVGDVIESVNGQAVTNAEEWQVRTARARAGEILTLRIRRHGESTETALLAPYHTPPVVRTAALGLRMRLTPAQGSEILSVEPGSAADRCGLAVGDVITLIGDIASPTPDQVRKLFTRAGQDRPIVVGVRRGTTHLVTALTR
jgi:S1-C subfamily serine protease